MTILATLLTAFTLILIFPVLARGEELPSLKMLTTPTCAACKQMSRVLDTLNSDYEGKLTTEEVNLLEHRDMAKAHNVKFVPHLLFLDGEGKVVTEKIGVISLEEVLGAFKEAGIEIG